MEKEAMATTQILPVVSDAAMSPTFSHIFPEVMLPDITATNGLRCLMPMRIPFCEKWHFR